MQWDYKRVTQEDIEAAQLLCPAAAAAAVENQRSAATTMKIQESYYMYVYYT